jgi:choline dehydrogenase-like flavoprotein
VADAEGKISMANCDYDVVIIGSGFGGSIAALRAAE